MTNHQLTQLIDHHATVTQELDSAFNYYLTQLAYEILTEWPQFVNHYCAGMGQATFDVTCEYRYAEDDLETNYETVIPTSTCDFAEEIKGLSLYSNLPARLIEQLRKFDITCTRYHDAIGPCYNPIMLTQQDGKITEKTDW